MTHNALFFATLKKRAEGSFGEKLLFFYKISNFYQKTTTSLQ